MNTRVILILQSGLHMAVSGCWVATSAHKNHLALLKRLAWAKIHMYASAAGSVQVTSAVEGWSSALLEGQSIAESPWDTRTCESSCELARKLEQMCEPQAVVCSRHSCMPALSNKSSAFLVASIPTSSSGDKICGRQWQEPDVKCKGGSFLK